MVYGRRNLATCVHTLRSTIQKSEEILKVAEVISNVSGNVWDCADESKECERDGIHAYLRAHIFDWRAMESLEAAAIQPTQTSTIADSNDPLSNGKDKNEEVFSSL